MRRQENRSSMECRPGTTRSMTRCRSPASHAVLASALLTCVALYLCCCILVAVLAPQHRPIWRTVIKLQRHSTGEYAGVYDQRLLLRHKAPTGLVICHLQSRTKMQRCGLIPWLYTVSA